MVRWRARQGEGQVRERGMYAEWETGGVMREGKADRRVN